VDHCGEEAEEVMSDTSKLMSAERLAECRRVVAERFQVGEYDYVGRDLLDYIDAVTAERDEAREMRCVGCEERDAAWSDLWNKHQDALADRDAAIARAYRAEAERDEARLERDRLDAECSRWCALHNERWGVDAATRLVNLGEYALTMERDRDAAIARADRAEAAQEAHAANAALRGLTMQDGELRRLLRAVAREGWDAGSAWADNAGASPPSDSDCDAWIERAMAKGGR
jgi:hypothetical protein